MLAVEGTDRLARLILVSCNALDNFPLGLRQSLGGNGKASDDVFGLFMQQMRLVCSRDRRAPG
jgi:hypothetical protein